MTFDPATLSPHARAKYIRVGTHYSSHDTVAQAGATLLALAKHAPQLIDYGFSQTDALLLEQARDALIAGEVTRTARTNQLRRDRRAYADAIHQAKHHRAAARTILLAVTTALRADGAPEDLERLATTTLQQTSRLPRTRGLALQLHAHLALLLATFQTPDITTAALYRGGPAIVTALAVTLTTLTTSLEHRSENLSSLEETEHLNLLDGIIVTLARQARRAARHAGRALGTPVIADAFTLRLLDNPPRKPVPPKPTPDTTAAPPPTAPASSAPSTSSPSSSRPSTSAPASRRSPPNEASDHP
ncbi:hypothetical protein [Chondromyces crocatus]|uniref:Uncharacterized protein n=1 Tax=Chondromyces crocatus TaxID=52 RepID=A0A0K1EIE2_CHOCO|nr:hypothetical protein [Chondromyces crocatus]AKT40462.1 uncharacterized protein CMC5_046170 [Chondromyces crocatus]